MPPRQNESLILSANLEPASLRSRAATRVRSHLLRPAFRAVRRAIGPSLYLQDPVSVDQRRELVSAYNLLHPAETLDFGDPALDVFLRSCQGIEEGKLSRSNIFVCEVQDAHFYPALGLVFSSRWQPLLESILDLTRFSNFRRHLRPRVLGHRSGVVSSVHHIFHNNHWHWTVDCLAQIHSLEQHMEGEPLTLLMPDLLSAPLREHLALVLPGHFTVEYVASEEWIACDRFVLPSYVSSRANGMLPPGYYDVLRERVFSRLDIAKPAIADGRYYISRSRSAHRRVLNEPEVVGVLESFGFQTIWMEDVSFPEQVRLLRGAEALVSAHGAGLGCMVYGDNLQICVLYPEPRPAGYFYTQARALGHRHFQSNSDRLEDDDFHVDCVELRRVLQEDMQLA